jgi:hypothetical protein
VPRGPGSGGLGSDTVALEGNGARPPWPLLKDGICWWAILCVAIAGLFLASARAPTLAPREFPLIGGSIPDGLDAIDLIAWSPLVMAVLALVLWRSAANHPGYTRPIKRQDAVIGGSIMGLFGLLAFCSGTQYFLVIGPVADCGEGPFLHYLWTQWETSGPMYHCMSRTVSLAEDTPTHFLAPLPWAHAWYALVLTLASVAMAARSMVHWWRAVGPAME